jgi:hypothetical protein
MNMELATSSENIKVIQCSFRRLAGGSLLGALASSALAGHLRWSLDCFWNGHAHREELYSYGESAVRTNVL